MERWVNRLAVVTGASSGIGAVLVRDLLKSGLIVVGLARRVEKVNQIRDSLPDDQKSRFYSKQCDVSKTASVNVAFDWITQTLGGVDILVNNAGTLQGGQLVTMDPQIIQDTINTNIMGIVNCTQRAFKSMKECNFDGHVILVNSISGHNVRNYGGNVPPFNIYPPSKFAVTAMNEVYRQEFVGLGTKIKVTSVSPGLCDTEIVSDERKALNEAILKPEDISNAIMFCLSTPPHVQIYEMTIKPVGEKY